MPSSGDRRFRKRPVPSAFTSLAICAVICVVFSTALIAQNSNVARLLREAQAREKALRTEIDARKPDTPVAPLLERVRTLVRAYDDISRLFGKSAYGDDALWHGGLLTADAFWEFGQGEERDTAIRLLKGLQTRFPGSALIKEAMPLLDRLAAAKSTPAETSQTQPVAKPTGVSLKEIRREALPGAMRVTLELEGETAFHDEQIAGPPRVFIDLQNTHPVEALKDVTQTFPDDVVRQIRVGRQLGTRTRGVRDLAAAAPPTNKPHYNPDGGVIDF
jgi:hypothetical protein